MKKAVRISAIVLAIIMILTVFSVSASAANDDFPGLPGHGANSEMSEPKIFFDPDDEGNDPQPNEPVNLNVRVDYRRQVESGGFYGIVGNVTYEDGTPAEGIIFYIALSTSAGIFVEKTNSEGIFDLYRQYIGETTLYFTVYPPDSRYICDPVSFTVYITGDSRSVTVGAADHGTASASTDAAKLGDIVTLNAAPEDGYRLKEWEVVKGDVTVENNSFIMPSGEVEIRPVFEEIPTHTVTIDCGAYGEDVVVEGIREGTRLFDALYAKDAFSVLDTLETDDGFFRDLATKPLAKFADEAAFNADAEALLDTAVTGDMTVYACFYQKIKHVSLSLASPVVGETVTVTETDERYVQTPAPVITLSKDAHCTVSKDSEMWSVKNSDGTYAVMDGTFAAGTTYCAELMLVPDFGWWLDSDTVVTADGGTVEEAFGTMALCVSISTQAVPLRGDANADGAVDILDATCIQRKLVNYSVGTFSATAARVTGNTDVTILDATAIQRHLVDLETHKGIGKPIR